MSCALQHVGPCQRRTHDINVRSATLAPPAVGGDPVPPDAHCHPGGLKAVLGDCGAQPSEQDSDPVRRVVSLRKIRAVSGAVQVGRPERSGVYHDLHSRQGVRVGGLCLHGIAGDEAACD